MDLIEVVIRESDDGDKVYVCAVPTKGHEIELSPSERRFLSRLLPKRRRYCGEGLWECDANANILNHLAVNGVRFGDENSDAGSVMKWHIDVGDIEVDDDDDNDDDNDDPWDDDE